MNGEPADPPVRVRWSVVVPVKESSHAKSRLQPPDPLSRPELARAVAADTLAAVCRAIVPEDVTVVTADDGAASVARELGAVVVDDPGAGLDAAAVAGLVAARERMVRRRRGSGAASTDDGYAVLLGDLPALHPDDLRAALAACAAYPRAVVPDAQGTGTVLLTGISEPPVPRFGSGSAARHAEDATLLDLDLPRLRRDVDTAADLADALALGVGPGTAAALARAVCEGPSA